VVTLSGSGLTAITRVAFNDVTATFQTPSQAEIQAIVPANASSGLITLTWASGPLTSAMPFSVSGPLPLISDFTPQHGAAGTSVVIAGAHFVNVSAVTFNGSNAVFTVLSTNQIIANAPSGVTTGPIRVTTDSGMGVSTRPFYGPPQISGFQPAGVKG
jgi:hypothetical protein